MRTPIVVAALAVVAPRLAAADSPLTGDDAVTAAKAMVAAFDAGEDAAIRKAFAAKVAIDHLWFADAGCHKVFGDKTAVVAKKQHKKLATCLAAAGWRPTAGGHYDLDRRDGTWVLMGV